MRRIIVVAVLLAAAACAYERPESPSPSPAPTPSPSPTPPPIAPAALSVSLAGGSGITGRQVVFIASVQGGSLAPYRYAFTFGDGSSTTLTSDARDLELVHVYGRAGLYAARLVVTDGSDRSGENNAEVRITDPPTPLPPPPPPPPPGPTYDISVSASPNPVVAGQPTQLTANAQPRNGAPAATAFEWDCLSDGTLDATTMVNVHNCIYTSAGTETATVVARSTTVSATGAATITVVADAPLFVGIAASPLNPALGSPVQFTATVTSAGNIPATLRWYWDWEDDDSYDHTVSGASPNIQTRSYGAGGLTTVKVRVVDEVTGREAISALDFTVQ